MNKGGTIMAKVLKSDLEREIEELKARLKEANEVNMRLINEKAEIVDRADESFENSCTYKQMVKEIEMLKLREKSKDESIES